MITQADRERFFAKVDKNAANGWTACVNDFGYGKFRVGGRNGRSDRAHRVSYEIANGPIPPILILRHKCDVPACVNPDHLETGTKADNTADMLERGRGVFVRGEASGRAKLTAAKVLEITKAPGSHRKLAVVYGISKTHVGFIKRRMTWKHLVSI